MIRQMPTQAELLVLICGATWRPFNRDERFMFAGAEGPNPMIAEGPDYYILCDSNGFEFHPVSPDLMVDDDRVLVLEVSIGSATDLGNVREFPRPVAACA